MTYRERIRDVSLIEAAAFLHVSFEEVKRLIRSGKLLYRGAGDDRLIPKWSLLAYLESSPKQPLLT